MITPQNVIQSIDQIPVAAPTPHAPKAPPAGASQTVIARMIVTTAPMMTACHADMRSTGRSTSSSTIGMSAMSVLPKVECAGSSDCTNEGSGSASMSIVPLSAEEPTSLRHDRPIQTIVTQ